MRGGRDIGVSTGFPTEARHRSAILSEPWSSRSSWSYSSCSTRGWGCQRGASTQTETAYPTARTLGRPQRRGEARTQDSDRAGNRGGEGPLRPCEKWIFRREAHLGRARSWKSGYGSARIGEEGRREPHTGGCPHGQENEPWKTAIRPEKTLDLKTRLRRFEIDGV